MPAVTEALFNKPVLDIRWIGPTSQVLLLLTQDAHVQRAGNVDWSYITNLFGLLPNSAVWDPHI